MCADSFGDNTAHSLCNRMWGHPHLCAHSDVSIRGSEGAGSLGAGEHCRGPSNYPRCALLFSCYLSGMCAEPNVCMLCCRY